MTAGAMRISAVLNGIEKIDRVVRVIELIGLVIPVIALVGIILTISANITIRHAFNWVFVEEFGGYTLVLITYLTAAYTLRSGGHISVTLILRRLSRRVREVVEVFTSLVGLTIVVFFLYRAVILFSEAVESEVIAMTPLGTPLSIPIFFISVGLSFFILSLTLHLARKILVVFGALPEEGKERLSALT